MFAAKSKKVDRQLLIIVALLVFAGFFIFISASLGLLARSGGDFQRAAMSQIILGVGLGGLVMFFTSKINYRVWKKFALPMFIVALLLTLLVFVPGLGFSSGGASRWIHLAGFSFQPAEFLKVATVIFAASYLSSKYRALGNSVHGLLAVLIIIGLPSAILLAQPDTGTTSVLSLTVIAMFFAAGARWRDISILIIAGAVGVALLAFFRPYVLDRLLTFIHPWESQQTSGYQIKQSLLAVGSGGFTGRGLGQSVQKFNYLPEPTSDSVFAVVGEEFGFLGGVALVFLFLWFAQRTFRIASRAPDYFGGLTVLGLAFLIIFQAILNISAMLGLAPLSGLPLPFISHGGTAMAVMLLSVGIILAVSRYAKV